MDYLLFLLGLALAAAGAELFLRGVLAIARHAGVPPLLVAATIAAFATSSPELSVAVLSAIDRAPQIGLGDALGANVVNMTLVLGITLAASRSPLAASETRREFGFALAAPLAAAAFIADGVLSRIDALLLLGAFLLWLAAVGRAARAHRRRRGPRAPSGRYARDLVAGLAGLVLLFAAGRLIVQASVALAQAWGMDSYVVAATLVAFGTTVPELATAVLARLKGEAEAGVGLLFGSNLFNGLLIVPVAALIHPIAVNPAEVLPALVVGAAAVLMLIPGRSGTIGRGRGWLLLAAYAAYVPFTLGAPG